MTAALHEVGVLRTRVEALATSTDRITRETERLAQLCDRQAAEILDLRRKLHAAATVHCWTNEDGKRFVFADDLAEALGYGPTAARTARPTALHHINGNPYDNRPENLQVVDIAAHTRTATPDTEEPQP